MWRWFMPGWPIAARRSHMESKGTPSVMDWLTDSRMAAGRRATLPTEPRSFAILELGLVRSICTRESPENLGALLPLTPAGAELFPEASPAALWERETDEQDLRLTRSICRWEPSRSSDALFPLTPALSLGER